MTDETPKICVCSQCGGVNLQVEDWTDANLDILIGGNDSPGFSQWWCEDCDDNIRGTYVDLTPELEEALKKRRIHLQETRYLRVLDAFKERMAAKLGENSHKGDRYRGDGTRELLARLKEEVQELEDVLYEPTRHRHREDISREAADVANLAMFLADNWGDLDVE